MSVTKEQLEEMFKGDNQELKSLAVSLSMQTDAAKNILNNHLTTGSASIKDKAFKEGQGIAYGHIDTVVNSMEIAIPVELTKASEKVAHIFKTLQQQIVDVKNAAPQDKSEEVAAIQAKLTAVEEMFATEKQTYEGKLEKLNLNSKIGKLNGIGLKYDEGQSKLLIDSFRATLTTQLVKDSTVIDGATVYNDENGKPHLNPDTRAYMTAEEVLKFKMADVLAKSNAGGDANQNGTSTQSLTDTDITLDTSKFTTTKELIELTMQVLANKGIANTDPRYNKIIEIAKGKYNTGLKEF